MARSDNDLEMLLLQGETLRLQAREEIEQRFAGMLSCAGGDDYVRFCIGADGRCIGGCTLFHFDRTAGVCELGIGIGDREYLGHGYGHNAVRVLLRYAFRIHNLHKVFLCTNSNNERAIRAYRACGFVEEGRQRRQAWSDGCYVDLVFMGILREEWEGTS